MLPTQMPLSLSPVSALHPLAMQAQAHRTFFILMMLGICFRFARKGCISCKGVHAMACGKQRHSAGMDNPRDHLRCDEEKLSLLLRVAKLHESVHLCHGGAATKDCKRRRMGASEGETGVRE